MSNLSSFNNTSDTISDTNKAVIGIAEVIPVLNDNGVSGGTQPTILGDFARTNIQHSSSSFPSMLSKFPLVPTWTSISSGTTSAIYTSTYGNNTYIYAGQSGILATSTDAVTWTNRTSGTAQNIFTLKYLNNLFIYGGSSGVLATSTDGVTWIQRTSGTTNSINTINYLNGLYIYGAGGSVLATSSDGITWSTVTTNLGNAYTFNDIIYSSGLYLASNRGGLLTSTNLTTWRTNYHSCDYRDVAYASNLGLYIFSSMNSITGWTNSAGYVLTSNSLNGSRYVYYVGSNSETACAASPDLLAIASASFGIRTSTDGINWTTRSTLGVNNIRYSEGRWTAISSTGGFIASTDGINWPTSLTSVGGSFRTSLWSGSLYVIVGDTGLIKTSPDGVTWTTQTSGLTNIIYGLVFGNGLYIALHQSGIRTSTDAITWTAITQIPEECRRGAYGNGKYVVAALNGNRVWYSSNGTTWAQSAVPNSTYLWSITTAGTEFVTAGGYGAVSRSSDAITWVDTTLAGVSNMTPSAASSAAQSILLNNSGYLLFGSNSGAISTSTDGITWTSRVSNTSQQINSLTFNNQLYSYAGNIGAFGTSRNGIDWITSTSGTTSNILGMVNAGTHVYVGSGGALGRSTIDTSSFFQVNITPNLKATNVGAFDLSKSLTYYIKSNDTTYSELPLGTVLEAVPSNKLQVETGKYLPIPGVYYKSSYPELFAQIGSQLSSPFIPASSATTSEIKSLAFGNSLYAYGGIGGTYATSTNGITWTSPTVATTNTIFSVIYGGTAGFIRAGWNGYLATSTSGTTWNAGNFFALEYGNNLYLIGGTGGLLATSTNGSTWTYRQSVTTSTIRSIIYAGGIYVYATTGGGIATSADGITWTQRTSGTTSNIYSIAYGGGLYTYVGHGGVIATSTDAVSWTSRTSGTTSQLGSIAYGNGRFVAVGNAIGLYSTDGITWTISTPSGATLIKVIYGNGIFLAIHSGQQLNWTSTDGITWTQRSNAYYLNQTSIAFGGGLFVMATDNGGTYDANYLTEYTNPYRNDTLGYIQTSTDGITWTGRGAIITPNSNHMVYDSVSTRWVTVHDNFISSSSTTPTTAWTTGSLSQSGTTSSIYALTFGNNLYTYAGNGGLLATSTDTYIWTLRSSGTTSTINTSIYDGSKYIYAGVGGCLGYSTDGVSWTTGIGTGTSSNLTSIIFAGTRYFYTGTGGLLSYSNDGTSWISTTTGTTQQINKIEFLNGTYFYVANGGVLATSSDGITWVLRTTGVVGDLKLITWDGTRYVANGNSLISSTDGITWTVNWLGGSTGKVGPEHSAYFGAPFNLHIGVGYSNQIVTSSNGQIWQRRTIPTTSGGIWHANYNSSLIIAVGDGGVILTSTDGITWTQRTSGTTQTLNGVVWNGTFWVIAGAGGVILTSPDGITWTARTSGTTSAFSGVEITQTKTVAITSTGTIFTSNHADCASWTSSTITTSAPYSWAYSSTLNVIAIGYQNGIWTSSDNSTTWTNRGNGNNWFGACWTGSYFCFVGYSVLKSSDGVTWTSLSNPSNIEIVSAHHDGTALYVMSTYNYGYPIMRSTDDGTTWKTALVCGLNVTNIATNGAGQFVYSRNQGFQTKYNAIVATNAFGYDGTDKVVLAGGYSPDYLNVKYLGNKYLVMGGGSSLLRVQSSTDGVTWTLVGFGTSNGVTDIAYYNNLYVASINTGSIYTSTDALTWTVRTTGTTTALNAIAVNNTGRYVAVGNTGVSIYSTDAINWTIPPSIAKFSGTTSNINALAYGNSVYVYAGAGGMVATSTDLITWTARTSGTTSAINALTYGNGVFTYYGTGGVVATSTDGITWTPRSSATTSQINAAVYNGSNLTIYGGVGGVLARSSDPTTATYSPIYDHQSQFYIPAVNFNSTNLAYVRAKP